MRPAEIDTRALWFLRTRAHGPRLDRLVAGLTQAGEHGACWLALGTLGALLTDDPGRRATWLRGVRVVAGAYALNQTIKLAVRRPRPELGGLEPLTRTVSRLSFPSAHAATSFAAALAYLRVAPSPALYLCAGMLALSRPYLGVHYPSDVIAGALLGTAVAAAWPREVPPR